MRQWMMVGLVSAMVACPAPLVEPSDTDTIPIGPLMEIDRTAIEFFEQPVGIAATPIEVEVYNRGDAPLDVYSIELTEPAVGYSLGTVGRSQRIDAGSRGTFVVKFRPPQPSLFGSQLVIDSNDSVTPIRRLGVTGTGVSSELHVSPAELTIGDVDVSQRVEVVLRNKGGVPLELTDVTITGHAGFTVDLDEGRNGSLPFEMDPLDPDSDKPTRSIFVQWTPDGSTSASATLDLVSNDYATPILKIPLDAN